MSLTTVFNTHYRILQRYESVYKQKFMFRMVSRSFFAVIPFTLSISPVIDAFAPEENAENPESGRNGLPAASRRKPKAYPRT
jgi:hypothetical protein